MASEPRAGWRGRLPRAMRAMALGWRLSSAIAVAAVLLVMGVAAFALGSPGVARWLVDRGVSASQDRLSVEGLAGSLWSGLDAAQLRYRTEGLEVRLRELRLRPDWRGLLAGRLELAELRAAEVEVVWPDAAPQKPDRSGSAPESIRLPLPFPLRVVDLAVDRLEIATGGARRRFASIRLAGEVDDSRYRIEHARLISEGFELTARDFLLTADGAPFRVTGQLHAEGSAAALAANLGAGPIGSDPAAPVEVEARLGGALDQLSASLSARAWGATLEARATVRPFAQALEFEISGSIRELATRRLLPEGPTAVLDGRFEFRGPRPTFSVDLENRRPARPDLQGLPVRRLALSGEWEARRLTLQRISVALARVRDAQPGVGAGPPFPESGRIEGQLSLRLDEPRLILGRRLPELEGELALAGIDLRAFVSGLPATRIGGAVRMKAGGLTATLEDRGLVSAPLRLDLQLSAAGDGVNVDRAQLELERARVSARGQVAAGPGLQLALGGRFVSLDPRSLGSLVGVGAELSDGDLSGSWQLSGALAGPDGFGFGLELDRDSRLAGAAIAGAASGQWLPGRLKGFDLRISQGRDRLIAQGALGDVNDRLALELQLADVGRLRSGLRGPAELTGHLGGRLDGLLLDLALRAGPIGVGEPGPSRLPDLSLAASASGTMNAHRIDLDVTSGSERLQLSGTAAYATDAATWATRIDRLRLQGRVPAVLSQPFDAIVRPGSAEVRGLDLTVAGGQLRLNALDWRDGRFRSEGSLANLSLAPVADWIDAAQARARQDGRTTREAVTRLRSLRTHARWALEGAAWQRMSGSLSLEVKPDPEASLDPGLDPGVAESMLSITLDEGRLAGQARLTVPSLAFTRRLTAPDWIADGSLSFDGRVAGSMTLPELDGRLNGETLSLANPSLGWRLRDGRLSARLDGRRLQIDSLRFASGDLGSIELLGQISPVATRPAQSARPSTESGSAASARAPFDADLDLRLERFIVPLDPGQRLLLSGRTRLVARGGDVRWSGEVKADEGLIEFRSGGAPELPADLVIVDRRRPTNAAPPQADLQPVRQEIPVASWTPVVETAISIALGERLRVQGGGFDARLTGELMLSGLLPSEPRLHGRVQMQGGTFVAYGRKLALTRGELRFNGEVDNPSLDIVAMRNNNPVLAGVALTGPARSPRVRLVSEPDVPDAQKLSWLVLGTGLEDAAAAGQALALREAALTLLGDDDGGLVGGLSQALGLDAIGFGRAAAGAANSLEQSRLGPPGLPSVGGASSAGGAVREEVVSVSKRLNSRLTISYERGIQGIWNLVRLQYEISNRLSLRAQSGSENAIDLLYFWWLD